MTASDNRIDNLYRGLDARERASLRLHWFKEDADEPPAFVRATPDYQIDEVNRLTSLFNATHHEISWYAIWLTARLETITARFAMLSALQLWALYADQVRTRLAFDAGEPITQTAYDTRLAAARTELVPVEDFAELLVEDDPDVDELSERQFSLRLREHERELRQLVMEGGLPGGGRGRKLQIPAGPFHDWRCQTVPVLPARGLAFEVFPDEAAAQVERLRAQREGLWELAKRAPSWPPAAPQEGQPRTAALGRGLTLLIAAELTEVWGELLALEQILQEKGEPFNGEEPLHPLTRAILEEAKARAKELVEGLKPAFGDLVLPEEANERAVAALTGIIQDRAKLP